MSAVRRQQLALHFRIPPADLARALESIGETIRKEFAKAIRFGLRVPKRKSRKRTKPRVRD